MQESIEIIKWTVVCSLLTIIIFLFFINNLVKLYQKRHLEFESKMRMQKLEKEKALLSNRIEAQEETIQKISKELHDNVNQILTLAKLNLLNLKVTETEYTKLSISNELLTDAIKEISNISNSLSSQSISDIGLLETIQNDVEKLNQIYGMEVDWVCEVGSINLSDDEQLLLYRIFQEAIKNALTHAKASKIEISFRQVAPFNELSYSFSIKDNGVGFTTSSLPKDDKKIHQGIRNMERRARALNAELEIKSQKGQGTNVTVRK